MNMPSFVACCLNSTMPDSLQKDASMLETTSAGTIHLHLDARPDSRTLCPELASRDTAKDDPAVLLDVRASHQRSMAWHFVYLCVIKYNARTTEKQGSHGPAELNGSYTNLRGIQLIARIFVAESSACPCPKEQIHSGS